MCFRYKIYCLFIIYHGQIISWQIFWWFTVSVNLFQFYCLWRHFLLFFDSLVSFLLVSFLPPIRILWLYFRLLFFSFIFSPFSGLSFSFYLFSYFFFFLVYHSFSLLQILPSPSLSIFFRFLFPSSHSIFDLRTLRTLEK